MKSQSKKMIEELERIANEKKDSHYQKEADNWKKCLEKLEKESEFSRLSDFYQLILNSWEELKNSTVTYRMLKALAVLEKNWSDTQENRRELLSILKKVSDEWER